MSRSGRAVSPARDWYIALGFSLIVMLVLCGVGVYQYVLAGRILDRDIEGTVARVDLDLDTVYSVVQSYRTRRTRFENLHNTSVLAPQPTDEVVAASSTIDVMEEGEPSATSTGSGGVESSAE